MRYCYLLGILLVFSLPMRAQDLEQLVDKARKKIETVQDYVATGKMKTNVTFLKVPVANVKIYFSKPDKMRIRSEQGVSFIPKGAVSINLGQLLRGSGFTVIDAGTDLVNGLPVRVAKLLPDGDAGDIVLSTLYIDPAEALIRKAKTTTRENGTYELEMTYGKYSAFGLPDKILFSFNARDYKLPKGITFDFDDAAKPAPKPKTSGPQKGRAEISIYSYIINKGIPPDIFKTTGGQ